MTTALKLIAATSYTLKADEGKEAAPSFKLRGLTGIEMMKVFEDFRSENGSVIVTAKAQETTIRYGLTGWDNFSDETGPVRFDKRAEKNLDRLPYNIIQELYGEIMNRSELPDADAKKS